MHLIARFPGIHGHDAVLKMQLLVERSGEQRPVVLQPQAQACRLEQGAVLIEGAALRDIEEHSIVLGPDVAAGVEPAERHAVRRTGAL